MAVIAFVGLGTMGSPMAVNLAAAGYDVRGWTRSGRAPKPEEAGVTRTGSAAEAIAAADIVLTMLPDLPEVVESCAPHLREGQTLVVMGTTSAGAVAAWADAAAAAGVAVVDAPVSGGDVGAQAGTLSIMVGATPEAFERVAPVLRAMGRAVRRFGPPGAGQVAKACNQIVVASSLVALAEAVALARASDLDVPMLLDALSDGLAASRLIEVKRQNLVEEQYRPGGSAAFQAKDLDFVLRDGRAHGVALPAVAVVAELYREMVDLGWGDLDHSGVVKVLEHRSHRGSATAERDVLPRDEDPPTMWR